MTIFAWMYFKKRMKRILLSLIMGFSFWGLFAQNNTFKTVDVTLLDVRTPAEHAEGYIPGTDFNIDVLEETYTQIALESLPKDKPVALYCRSGNRSKKAASILSEKGYQVVELGSGFKGWSAAGKKVEKIKNK